MPLETVSPKLPHFVNLGVGQIVTATAQLIFTLDVCLTHQHVRQDVGQFFIVSNYSCKAKKKRYSSITEEKYTLLIANLGNFIRKRSKLSKAVHGRIYKLYFWVFISLELFHAKWELHIANNYQINVQKVNLSQFYPRNPLFTPQNGFERSAELKPTLTMSARPQMTQVTQKIKMDRPVTRTPLFLTQESAL